MAWTAFCSQALVEKAPHGSVVVLTARAQMDVES